VILPADQHDRNALYRNITRECLHSQDRRRAYHRRLRNLALNGTEGSGVVHQNKLWEWVQASSAYCFAPEFVKFGVTLPKRYGDTWLEELDACRDDVGDFFVDTGLDKIFSLAVETAHYLPLMWTKVITSDDRVAPELVDDPADVSVWEENLPIEKQEALVHTFDMNLHAVIRLISAAIPDREERELLIRKARDHQTRGPSGGALAPAVPRLVLAAAGPPSMIGAFPGGIPNFAGNMAEPEVEADVVPMSELWIRDDLAYANCGRCHHRESDDAHAQGPLHDHAFERSGEHEWEWRKVLAMGRWGDDVLWGSLNPLLRQQHPMIPLQLSPVTGYAYGISPMEQMIALQLQGESLLNKHDRLLDLQLDPPIAIIGLSSVDGERAKLLRNAGGTFTMPFLVGADIKRFAPDTPPDAAGMHKLIDEKFDRLGGLPMGANPVTDANVRSAGQMTAGASLSSPRTNRRAMRVEDALEDVMTPAYRLHRRVSRDPLRIPLTEPDPDTGKPYRQFYLTQIPGELNIRVSAHSASPLYRTQAREDAVVLRREQVVDDETFVELFGPMLHEMVRAKARRLAAGKAKMRERAIEVKEREAAAKEAKARK
jgi:hypothetical protein